MNNRINIRRTLSAILALTLVLCLAGSALAESFSAAVQSRMMAVYSDEECTQRIGSLKKNTIVTVHSYSDGTAKISMDGNTGYAAVDDLVALSEIATLVEVNTRTRVYQSPRLSSANTTLPKGMEVYLLATSGDWAMIENAGIVGYTYAGHLTEKNAADDDDAAGTLPAGEPAIFNTDSRVYAKPSRSSASMALSRGFRVNLIAVSGDWAMIENNGVIGYADADHVSKGASLPDPEPTATPESDDSIIELDDPIDVTFTADSLIYQKASRNSASLRVQAGQNARMLAAGDGWALVQNNGLKAYTLLSNLAPASDEPDETPTPTPTPTPTATPTPKPTATPTPAATSAPAQDDAKLDYMQSSKYSNEEKCFLFLTREGGLSTAAACGILANIRRECNFDPSSGGSHYGLCQWGGGRLTNMKKFCAQNGYAEDSLEGQLYFLMYEMKKSYSKVYNYLTEVDDSAQGAYDAGYYFCYYYERPAKRESSSVTRGNLARDTYYPKYAG